MCSILLIGKIMWWSSPSNILYNNLYRQLNRSRTFYFNVNNSLLGNVVQLLFIQHEYSPWILKIVDPFSQSCKSINLQGVTKSHFCVFFCLEDCLWIAVSQDLTISHPDPTRSSCLKADSSSSRIYSVITWVLGCIW